jgi:dihydrofolate reductase
MRKVVFAINMSIDGYYGHESGVAADDELHAHFTNLLKDSGVEILGRNTYQLMYPFWNEVAKNQSETKALNEFALAYNAVPKLVFSTTLQSAEWGNATLMRSGLKEEILKLKEESGKNIGIGSLNVASQVASWDLIDEYHFVVHPIIAGKGPRLFKAGGEHLLKLVSSKAFASGAVALHYTK